MLCVRTFWTDGRFGHVDRASRREVSRFQKDFSFLCTICVLSFTRYVGKTHEWMTRAFMLIHVTRGPRQRGAEGHKGVMGAKG